MAVLKYNAKGTRKIKYLGLLEKEQIITNNKHFKAK